MRAVAFIGLICISAAACGMQRGHSANSGPQAAGSQPASGQSSGQPGAQPTGQPSARPTGGSTARLACTGAQIDVTLDLKSAGVAAGTSLIPLDFTNVSTGSCRLAGYAFVTFATGSQGRQVGAASTADHAIAAKTLRLSAGTTAHLWLRIVEATNLPAAQCQPVTVAGLRVRLPGQAGAIFLAHHFRTCAKRIHGTDILTVEPFQAGRAQPGTAQ